MYDSPLFSHVPVHPLVAIVGSWAGGSLELEKYGLNEWSSRLAENWLPLWV